MDYLKVMKDLGITRTVYSLYLPETRKVIDELTHPFPHDMYEEAETKKQDEMHMPFLDGWRSWVSEQVEFSSSIEDWYSYPCNGSSEAIRESIAYYASRPYTRPLCVHVFDGEYEGYQAFAEGYNIHVVKHDRNNYAFSFNSYYDSKQHDAGWTHMNNDLFFISQPSAIDGNVWDGFDEFVKWMEKKHPEVKIMVDLCYVGCTLPIVPKIDLTAKNIHTIYFSLSKVFGLYYYRSGGVFTKDELPGLYGNMWFKNLLTLHIATELMKRYKCSELMMVKYKQLQKICVDDICHRNWLIQNKIYQINEFSPSDVFLLAHKKRFCPEEPARLAFDGQKWGGLADVRSKTIKKINGELARGDTVRACLKAAIERKL